MIRTSLRVLPLLACLVGLASCGGDSPSSPSASRSVDGVGGSPSPLRIVCTTGMVADMVKNIAGDRAEVTALMGQGVDPHLYKASPGDLRLLTNADMVFFSGLHLEGKMADALERLGESKPVVAVGELVDASRLRSSPDFGGQHDPHIWFDVALWATAVNPVRDALIKRDPDARATYETNASTYADALGELHAWCREQLGAIPKESRVLVTAHDAFGYFGDAYDVEVMAIQGISTDSEPSLSDINSLVDTLVKRRILAVFVESSVPPKTIESLVEGCTARGHGLKIGGELFSDAMGAPGTPEGTYIGMVKHNVTTIRSALLDAAAQANNRPEH